jgi:cell pole-organizing protein PopZ
MSDASASVAREPSMDELLQKIQQSIRDEPRREAPAEPTRTAEILTLTDSVGEGGAVRRMAPLDVQPEPVPEPELASPRLEQGSSRPEAPDSEPGQRLISDATAGAAAAAFAQLAAVQRERRRASEFPMGSAHTLEDVVRELLRPMMTSWLDERLPVIIERLVRAELARALDQAVRV